MSASPMIDDQILNFLLNLNSPKLPSLGIETMNPYQNEETQKVVKAFYSKFYHDDRRRLAFIGINPGRLGSGITGIGFTDPVNLKTDCGIENSFDQKHELSSKFVYEMIKAFGGVEQFYQHVFISSVVPLGFTKEGKNVNYYDDSQLEKSLLGYIKDSFEKQLPFLDRSVAFCIGKGKNQKFLEKLNREEGYFEKIEILPHPRWVMQYRLKRKEEFIKEFVDTIGKYIL